MTANLGALRMHERIGEGLHLAWLVQPARLIAVKRFHPLAYVDARRRHVRHPNVVATLGFERREREMLAGVEYVPGATLAEVRDSARTGLEPRIASAIIADALRGLDARCAAGETHDLAWCDVIVGEDGRARVTDLAIATPWTASEAVERLPYASPEQLVCRGVGRRREVYTAAVMLWETLTGRPLFRASTVEGTLQRILAGDVLAPSRFARDVPAALDAIVVRGVARDPRDRFASAGEMADALERACPASGLEVARALGALDLECIRRRRALAHSVCQRESRTLHIECNRSGSKG